MGKPTFTDTLETAAIAWNLETKNFIFYFNPSFFDSLTNYELSFVTAHECLHVYFNHGERSAPLIPILANIALDISVNTILLDYFDFKE
jgi:predicted metal-dependent peptidase